MAAKNDDFWAKLRCARCTRSVNIHIGPGAALDRTFAVGVFRCEACGGRGAIAGFWRGEREPQREVPIGIDRRP